VSSLHRPQYVPPPMVDPETRWKLPPGPSTRMKETPVPMDLRARGGA
jgi:hypothetical protein